VIASVNSVQESSAFLSRLETLLIGYEMGETLVWTARMRHLQTLLRLPRLKMLDAEGFGLGDFDVPFKIRTPWALKRICLRMSAVDPSGVEEILELCPSLRELRLQCPSTGEVGMFRLGDTLRAGGSRLRTLELWSRPKYEELISDSIGSLKALKELQVLRVPCKALVGSVPDGWYSDDLAPNAGSLSDLLPQHLKTLGFLEFDQMAPETFVVRLVKLLVDTSFDSLRDVEISSDMPDYILTAQPLIEARRDIPDWTCTILEEPDPYRNFEDPDVTWRLTGIYRSSKRNDVRLVLSRNKDAPPSVT